MTAPANDTIGDALSRANLVLEEITDLEGREGLTDYEFAEQVIALAHQHRDAIRNALALNRAVLVTDEMVTAAMRAFEPFAGRLLRYPEKDRWHLNDIQGMREAIKAAFALAGCSPDTSVRDILIECLLIVEREPEAETAPTAEQVATMEAAGVVEITRASIRATKKAISANILKLMQERLSSGQREGGNG